MPDVVVAAGVDAARDLDLQRPDVALPVEVGEGLGDPLRHRDRPRRRQRAVVHARAGDDVGDQPDVRRREPRLPQPRVDRRQVPPRHVRQDDVLLVADAQLVVGVLLGEIGEQPHLLGGRVARRAADRLQRHRDDGVVRHPVRGDVGVDPGAQARRRPAAAAAASGLERRRREGRLDLGEERRVDRPHLRPALRERRLDLLAHRRRCPPRARGSSAAPCTCCRAGRAGCRSCRIASRYGSRSAFGRNSRTVLRDHRRPPEAAADHHLVARSRPPRCGSMRSPMSCERITARSCAAPVMPILNLRAEPVELRMVGRPLPDQLRRRPRILDLVGGRAGEMVGGHVADAVAAGLDRVHLDVRQRLEDVGHVAQLRPVELDVRAGW